MKVLLINGSPHEHGCTDAALSLVADALRENGVEAETYWLGVKPVTGCIGCRQCEAACPQHLPIRTHLKTVSQRFDGFQGWR